MARLLLIASNTERRPYPAYPLGLCLVAEEASKQHDVQVYDGLEGDPDSLRAQVKAFDPDLVGLGIRNIDNQDLRKPRSYVGDIQRDFMTPIREATDAPVLLGGSGFSIFPQELIARLGANGGVVGPGERAIEDVLNKGIPSDPIHGTCAGPPPSGIGGDHWVDFGPYRGRGGGSFPVQTTRGCSRNCLYCTYPAIEGARPKLRRPQSVVDEIERIRDRLGPVTVEFVDSVFNDPPEHAEALCRLLGRSRSVRLRTMGLNPRGVTEKLLRLMGEAGFAQLDCTPDSASPAMLRRLGKGFDRQSLEDAATRLRRVGIPTMWFFLIGGPGESTETIKESFDFIDRFVDPEDMALIAVGIRVYPGTELHRIALEEAVVRPGQSLLEPCFYVSPALGPSGCIDLVEEACASRPNCVPLWESTPSPALLGKAQQERLRGRIDEPMFRTLLRLRRDETARSHRAADEVAP